MSTWREKDKLTGELLPKVHTKCKGAFEFEELALHKNKSYLVIRKALYAYFIDGVTPEQYLPTNTNLFDYCAGAKLKGDWYFEEVGIEQQIRPELSSMLGMGDDAGMADYLWQHGWRESYGPDNWVRADAQNQEVHNGLPTEVAFERCIQPEAIIVRTRHQKLLRYYISTTGNKLIKRSGSKKIQLEAGKWKQVTCNQYVKKDFADYQVDLRYYLDAIKREISTIESTAAVVVLNTKAAQLSLF